MTSPLVDYLTRRCPTSPSQYWLLAPSTHHASGGLSGLRRHLEHVSDPSTIRHNAQKRYHDHELQESPIPDLSPQCHRDDGALKDAEMVNDPSQHSVAMTGKLAY